MCAAAAAAADVLFPFHSASSFLVFRLCLNANIVYLFIENEHGESELAILCAQIDR